MANEFQTLQIRLGLGPKPWGALPTSYADFERDAFAATQRSTTVGLSQALSFLKEAKQTPRSDIGATESLKSRSQGMKLRRFKNMMTDAAIAPIGFGDQLYFFWCNHFAARPLDYTQQGIFISYQEEAIRKNMMGKFANMLFEVELHPLMLEFLGQNLSCGPTSGYAKKTGRGLNENLGREILELHTLGVAADYTQSDVRELALLLTGTRYTPERGTFFDPYWAEIGERNVMGKKYNITSSTNNLNHVRTCLLDLSLRAPTAWYVCGKLAKYFCSDLAPADLIRQMVTAWINTGGKLSEVYKVLIRHPAVLANFGKKVKWPVEYLASGLRVLGLSKAALDKMTEAQFNEHLSYHMDMMGQPWDNVPGPNGWSDNQSSWITPGNMTARIEWAYTFPKNILGSALPDVNTFVDKAMSGHGSKELRLAVSRASTRREAVMVLLASNEFNRR